MYQRRLISRSSSMMNALRKPPLVTVIGATGTGKSQLAIELARRFDGEVINGDAMQLYDGLPVITNKVTKEEMEGVPHHLLGCIGLNEPTWTVTEFVSQARAVIDDVRSRGKLPILVGGTHYYTQSLLFQEGLASDVKFDENDFETSEMEILKQPTSVILEELRKVDPIMANRWHPNDRRKIQRSLQIWLKTGMPASKYYEQQQEKKRNSVGSEYLSAPKSCNSESEGEKEKLGLSGSVSATMAYPTLVLWVYAETDVLRPRLDSRVEKMVDSGLLDEVKTLNSFLASQEASEIKVDKTRGIWVSIGFKEFEEYQRALESGTVTSSELEGLKRKAIEMTQGATRRYAKSQERWIRIKLFHAMSDADQLSQFYLLDGSNITAFETEVTSTAARLVKCYINGEALPEPASVSLTAAKLLTPKRDYDLSQRRDLWIRKICNLCSTVAVTEDAWEKHIKSRGHRRAAKRERKDGYSGTIQSVEAAAEQAN
jgi:tRNA dimethylallyltransferase